MHRDPRRDLTAPQPPPISIRTITRHVGVNKRADMEYYCASACSVWRLWLKYDLSIRGTGGAPVRWFVVNLALH